MRSYNLQTKLTSGNRHLMLIKEHCGVGKSNKTAEEIKTLCHSDSSSVSILIISVLFEGFKSYLELDIKKLNSKDTLKLIISPKSIHKLGATSYDIILLDEFKTITQNFSKPTMKKLKLSYDIYKSLLQSVLLILALDAILDSDLFVYLQTISKIDTENSTNIELIGALKQELKDYILIFASVKMAEALHKKLKSQGYQDKLTNLDYLIVTPVMTCKVRIIVKNFEMIFAHFYTLAGLTNHKDLLCFISYRCNITEYPDLEEAHYDKTLTFDSKWIFKPNASLETHFYNASHHNVSRNNFVGLLANCLNECSYDISSGYKKYSMIANAPVLNNIEALDIREYLEREENIDPAYRFALQKYNLASFYKKIPEDITEDFMRNAYSALVQAMNPLDDLRENYKFIVIGYLYKKASCDSLFPKVIALEKILQGIDRENQLTHLKLKIDRNLKMILPDTCLSNNVIADSPKSDLNSSQDICHIIDNTIAKIPNVKRKIGTIHESIDEANFLEYKQNFEAKMKVPTTSHKKELKNKSLAIIEYV
ncbi:10552_t:CDS:10 [Gigaspora margarita]|uniref:10552_t:CDS:1 n=1 Tax=Gigaspora margarita TaxID=4874 RepID=A0ABN7VNU8_GIGMA|nr:10552_t:CDS:10 [Gigaspora margarita]